MRKDTVGETVGRAEKEILGIAAKVSTTTRLQSGRPQTTHVGFRKRSRCLLSEQHTGRRSGPSSRLREKHTRR
jgi:hypothetical protein